MTSPSRARAMACNSPTTPGAETLDGQKEIGPSAPAANAQRTVELPALGRVLNRARTLDLAIALTVVLPRLAFLLSTHITYEDSLITLRYAENFAHGHGLVYNLSE